jgi:hypothetical protein
VLSCPACQTLNVFLDEQLNVRLGDLGVAKVCAGMESTLSDSSTVWSAQAQQSRAVTSCRSSSHDKSAASVC